MASEPEEANTGAKGVLAWHVYSIKWFFKQGIFTLITAPLFLILIYCVIYSVYAAVFQCWLLFRVDIAVFGFTWWGLVLNIWVCTLIFSPPMIYWLLIIILPAIWRNSIISRRRKIISTLIIFILFDLVAALIVYGVSLEIGSIADRNPCAALSVGITGSKPPTNCP